MCKRTYRDFSNEDIKMANKYIKMCLTSLIIRNVNQNHEIPLHTNKCWQGYEKEIRLIHWWWECKLLPSLWKTVWRFLKKLKIELPYDPAIPLLSIYPMETKSLSPRDICTSVFIAAFIHNRQGMEIT